MTRIRNRRRSGRLRKPYRLDLQRLRQLVCDLLDLSDGVVSPWLRLAAIDVGFPVALFERDFPATRLDDGPLFETGRTSPALATSDCGWSESAPTPIEDLRARIAMTREAARDRGWPDDRGRIVARRDATSAAFLDALTTKSDPAWVRAWARRQRAKRLTRGRTR